MYLTQHLNYRWFILCTPPCSIKNPNLLACLPAIRLYTSRPCGPFPCPHVLIPTCCTARLASWTGPLLQLAPSVSHLVRVFTAKTDWVPVVLLGSCLGIRSGKPISHCTPFPLHQRFHSCQCTWTRVEPHFHWHMDKPQYCLCFLCLPNIGSYRGPSELTDSITAIWILAIISPFSPLFPLIPTFSAPSGRSDNRPPALLPSPLLFRSPRPAPRSL